MENRQEDAAACRGMPTELFFPDLDDPNVDVSAAQTACASCELRSDCLAGALGRGERAGIWAGIIFEISADEVRAARAARAAGDGPNLLAFVGEAIAATERFVNGEKTEWPWVEAHDCPRCETRVEAGYHPPDKNGNAATCGLPSTYNKGCRCWRCRKGKSRYYRESKGS